MIENNIEQAQVTLKTLEDRLLEMEVPISLFKTILRCAINDDFTELDDPVIKTRYKTSYEKVFKHIQSIVYQDVYIGSTSYDNFIGILIKLYAVFDVLIEGRLRIADISMQSPIVVKIFLESYGFDLHTILDDDVNKDIARTVYYHLRRKGTPESIAIMLNHMGFTHYRIDEYILNKRDDEWLLVPEPIYTSSSAKNWSFETKPFKVAELDDAMWWLEKEELDYIFESMRGAP